MIVGVDIAAVDDNNFVKWPQFMSACQQAGSTAGFAIFRGAYGTDPDPTVQREWKRAQSYGLTTGAYLLLRMHKDMPPEDQGHVFADTVGTLTASDLVPIIDVEDTGLSAEAELDYVHRVWTTLRGIYGVPPMIYDSERVWREDLHNLPAGEMVDSPQWVAKPWPWPRRSPAQLSSAPFATGKYDPAVPAPWGPGNWMIHQYQGDAYPVPGFTSTVDLSRFHVLRIGDRGGAVGWVQRRMGIRMTQIFDVAMDAAVRSLQKQRGLVVDGVIGPKTFAKIAWMTVGTPAAA